MFHQQTEALGAWEEVVFEDWIATRPGKLHTQLVFLFSESCSLCKYAELLGGGGGGGGGGGVQGWREGGRKQGEEEEDRGRKESSF